VTSLTNATAYLCLVESSRVSGPVCLATGDVPKNPSFWLVPVAICVPVPVSVVLFCVLRSRSAPLTVTLFPAPSVKSALPVVSMVNAPTEVMLWPLVASAWFRTRGPPSLIVR